VAGKRDVERMQQELEELFSDLWQVPRLVGNRRGFRPPVDCYRSEHPPRLTVVVELAGVDAEDIRLVATHRTLTIAGERRRPRDAGRVERMELDYGPFEREIALAGEIDPAGATASYRRGLLQVVLPLAPRAAPAGHVRIEVRMRR
jgi:HSP20 family protein